MKMIVAVEKGRGNKGIDIVIDFETGYSSTIYFTDDGAKQLIEKILYALNKNKKCKR